MKKNTKNIDKTKKVTFWGTMVKAIKEGIRRYKAEMEEQVNKHRLISSKSDWSMLESFVQQCNSNQNLRVEIILTDGTRINMKTYVAEKTRDYDLLEVN